MLLEYQAKALLAKYGLPLPEGKIVEGETVPFVPCILKVQVPHGGRGKAGGIIKATNVADATTTIRILRSKSYYGFTPQEVYCEKPLDTVRELYLALKFDRDTLQTILLAHRGGGVDIETASGVETPFSCSLSALNYPKLAEYLTLEPRKIEKVVRALSQAFEKEDMLLAEINPLILTAEGDLSCADAKVVLDTTARFRHPNWPVIDASPQFVVIDPDGQLGTAANGAGLAMATTDALQAAGLAPYNFYDVGGGLAGEEFTRQLQALTAAKMQAIVINIFGGITQCDEIARRIISARNQITNLPQLLVRLAGTNSQEGQHLLREADIAVFDSLEAIITELQS